MRRFNLLLFWGECVAEWRGLLGQPSRKPCISQGPMQENLCAYTTTCPAYATCTATTDSFYCTCKRGFRASNGQIQFKDPGVKCNGDSFVSKFTLPISYIDECLTSGVCPEHSHCANSMGSYSCNCQVGFISSKSTCEEVDECANPGACPEYATCYNTLGNYSCICNPGFESSSGPLSFQGVGGSCEDIDECTVNTCPVNATCTNTPGSYFCTCHPGFAPSNGQPHFADQKAKCRDIDECSQDPSPCGPHSVCTNAPGSYSCSCMVGFRPDPEGFQKYGNFSCKRLLFKCKEDVIPQNKQVQQCQGGAAVKPEYVSFCALINATFRVLDDVCENKTTVVSLKSTAKSLTPVLEQMSTLSKSAKEKTTALATVVLESVESTTLAALLDPSANVSQTIRTENLDIESKVINEECTEQNIVFNLKAKGDEMKIGCSTIKESSSTGTVGVAFVSFVGMESALDERFFQDLQTSLANSKTKLKINSRIVGGIMTGGKKENFSDPVIYTLENIRPKQELESPICVSWRTDAKGGGWTTSGCVVQEASKTHTTCGCNQMVNLAVIMASGEVTMEFSLYIISHVGMITSLVCLILAIATFLLCRSIQNRNTYLHLNLCVCLFLADILFLIGIDKTDNQTGCTIVAGALHYLFLACFFWMLVEAVMLFLMVRNLKVVNYFSSRNVKLLYLCAFSYGLPALVVAVSASVHPKGYGMDDRCWLDTKMGFIWSFLGPVCAIMTVILEQEPGVLRDQEPPEKCTAEVNFILLTWTLCILRQKLSSVNAEVSTLKDTRLLTFKAFAQFFVLGCTWVLGVFQIGPIAGVMAYLFTITNSLQGAFIFLIHCLLSHQVREEYRRWITGRTKASSQSQSSGILLSSVPSTSKTVRDLVLPAGAGGRRARCLATLPAAGCRVPAGS
uniref:Adhesion G protein-coupled receptor E1 n=1 Tax=Propithecus coquereli TaxID=379532 RepID=A0A2K6EJ02_PROCO